MKASAQRQTSSLDPADRAALLEYLPAAHSLEGLAWRFVPKAEQPQVLATEALLAAIGQIPRHVSDPGVALAKLAWWQQELLKLEEEDPRHPLTRALLGTGAAPLLQPAVRNTFLAAVADEVDAPAPATTDELKQRLERSAGTAALVRCAIDGNADTADALRAAGAGIELLGRLEALAREPLPDWLPMELVARFSLRRGASLPAEVAPALFRALAAEGLAWVKAARPLELLQDARLVSQPASRLLLLRLAISHRRLQRIDRWPGRYVPVQPPALTEVLGAWNVARRLYAHSDPRSG